MKRKKITITVSGTGEPRQIDVELVKGSDRRDLLRGANLPETTTLIRKTTGEQLRDGQDLYEQLQENELVIATPVSDVASLRDAIASRLSLFFQPKVKIVGIRKLENAVIAPITVRPAPAPRPSRPRTTIMVLPPELLGQDAELESMGFRRDKDGIVGSVSDIAGARHPVKLEKNFLGYRLYVQSPPSDVLYGPHSLCFRPVGRGWYWVHFNGCSDYAPGLVRSLKNTFIASSARGSFT